MKIPADAIIPEAKLTKYLLEYKPRNDKSRFLFKAGFTMGNWQLLKLAIRQLSQSVEAQGYSPKSRLSDACTLRVLPRSNKRIRNFL